MTQENFKRVNHFCATGKAGRPMRIVALLVALLVVSPAVAGAQGKATSSDAARRRGIQRMIDRATTAPPARPDADTRAYVRNMAARNKLRVSKQTLALMAREEAEDLRCHEASFRSYIACNRRSKLLQALEDRGVCWSGAGAAAEGFMRCSRIAGYKYGNVGKPYYSNQEIWEAAADIYSQIEANEAADAS